MAWVLSVSLGDFYPLSPYTGFKSFEQFEGEGGGTKISDLMFYYHGGVMAFFKIYFSTKVLKSSIYQVSIFFNNLDNSTAWIDKN